MRRSPRRPARTRPVASTGAVLHAPESAPTARRAPQADPGARVERAARLGHRVDRLPGLQRSELAAGVTAESGQSPVRRYQQETLTTELDNIKNSTASAENLLDVNSTAQTNLKAEENSGKKLAPYMTTLGLEVEFAQQSDTVPANASAENVVLKSSQANRIDNAHIEIADADGLAMYTDIPFMVESDAARALEFVTPPLLAPLEETQKGGDDIIPDRTWEKAAVRALEFGLKDRVEQPTTIETWVDGVNTDFPVNLEFKDDGYKNHVYGPIRKENKRTHTNAQVNYMTTLRHYAEINMSGVGGRDPETQKILTLLWDNGLSDRFVAEDDTNALRAYAFAVSQKLREIPGAFNDYIFSIVLHADTNAPAAQSREETIVNWSQSKLSQTSQHDHRWLLALEASKIKDQAQLWLKASYHQILAAIPAQYRAPIVQVVGNQQAALLDLLVKARVFPKVRSVLMRYFGDDETQAKQNLNLWFQKALANTSGGGLGQKATHDEQNRPRGQKDTDNRLNIVGARADTYTKTGAEQADDPLFLVESRLSTTYLGLEKRDRYRYVKALEKVDTQLNDNGDQAAVRQYFPLRDRLEAAELAVQDLDKLDDAKSDFKLITDGLASLQEVEELIRLGEQPADVAANNAKIDYVRAAVAVRNAEQGDLTARNVLAQAQQWYNEI